LSIKYDVTMDELNAYQTEFDKPAAYEVIVSGTITPESYACVEGLSARTEYSEDGKAVTILTGILTDQAVLAGLLGAFYERHLTIISVRKLPDQD